MDRGGAVEQYRAGQAVPDIDRELEAFFGGIERNNAERVVDEMRRNISEENEAGGHPQVPAERAEGQLREQFLAPKQSEVDRICQGRRSTDARSRSRFIIFCYRMALRAGIGPEYGLELVHEFLRLIGLDVADGPEFEAL